MSAQKFAYPNIPGKPIKICTHVFNVLTLAQTHFFFQERGPNHRAETHRTSRASQLKLEASTASVHQFPGQPQTALDRKMRWVNNSKTFTVAAQPHLNPVMSKTTTIMFRHATARTCQHVSKNFHSLVNSKNQKRTQLSSEGETRNKNSLHQVSAKPEQTGTTPAP